MLENYITVDFDKTFTQREIEADFTSERLQESSNTLEGELRSLLNSKSRENIEITAETVRSISTTTLIFDGKSEKLEPFEDRLHIMIKVQPDMSEAMKINLVFPLLRKKSIVIVSHYKTNQ